jgi:hypothetical protein
MSAVPPIPEFEASLVPFPGQNPREAELEALLRSGLVRERTQLHSLLVYLGRKSLESPSQLLKEYTIGIEALGKPEDYDPRLDPTVRVEVAKLRKRLAEYYAGPGSPHRVRLTIPKGGYMPVFVEDTPSPAAIAAAPVPRWKRFAWPAVVAVLLAAILFLAFRKPEQRSMLAPEIEAFWGPQLTGSTPNLIVFGAPLFLKVDNSFFRDTHVNRVAELDDSPQVRSVTGALRPKEVRPIYHFTGLGEAEAIFHVTRVLAFGKAALDVKRSNAVGWDDLKNRNIVIIGGRKFNPQIPDLPFQPKFSAEKGKVANLKPQAGELAEYPTVRKSSHGDVTADYAVVSVYPGFGPETRIVTLESASTEGTLAAAEFVTRPDTLKELLRRNLLARQPGGVRPFQAVIGARFNDGVVVKLDYVTHALLQ